MIQYEQHGRYVVTFLLSGAFFVSLLGSQATAQTIEIRSKLRKGDFPLVHLTKASPIIVSDNDHQVIHIAASDLALDIERVTGKKPVVTNEVNAPADTAVIIGTVGKSGLIETIINHGKLDAYNIRGKWESFIITTVDRPLPNIKKALVIAGSDRRGTAFGVYELSQMIGVSPWYWWADVTPERKTNLILSPGTIVSREPSVKYRGIFINDEDWGLQPWAAKTFEPETGDIGPKTYAKVFELLLRLKANTLWPAMHEVTKPFNSIAGNAQMADDYAIVMGSSHVEPMLRNNVGEWKADKNAYNFVTDPDSVTAYWEERAKENGRYENIYTIGMRGIHDSPILGTKSQAERVPLLEKIFSVQRGLIAKHVNSNVNSVPQIFCPYKEVLADYRAGLKVPDDVTIVFPDDNFGYIRQFPTAEEQKRKGGFGVYYHISYLGRPLSYLWLNTTPPALIWQEMNKAYENGMRQLWIVNVGDIKPGEIGMEFFLQIAYDADRWTIDNQHEFLEQWAAREFGSERADAIADILDQYYRLGFQRKPEHLQWYLPTEPKRTSVFTDNEIRERLGRYAEIVRNAEGIGRKLTEKKRAAFYQLILYPIRSAKFANERYFAVELALRSKSESPETAREWALRSIKADEFIQTETTYFNNVLSGGRWRGMMSPEMGPGQWPSMRSTPPNLSLDDFPGGGAAVASEKLPKFQRPSPIRGYFREQGGVISIEAESCCSVGEWNGFKWRRIRGLGKTGDSVSVFPSLATSFEGTSAPMLEYQINADGGEYSVEFYLLPTQPLLAGSGLRLAFATDEGEPQIVLVDKDTEVSSPKWAQNILNANTRGHARVTLGPGVHRIRVYGVDSGVVLDKIVLSKGVLPSSYFGPPETSSVRTTL